VPLRKFLGLDVGHFIILFQKMMKKSSKNYKIIICFHFLQKYNSSGCENLPQIKNIEFHIMKLGVYVMKHGYIDLKLHLVKVMLNKIFINILDFRNRSF
jgi:hypothetical protein